eukprot:jgi/Botrbrau1/14351/Bobra.0014s0008.2
MAKAERRVLGPLNNVSLSPLDTRSSKLRKSLGSALSIKGCPPMEDSPTGLSYELARLQNEIRHKDRELAAKEEELRTLRTTLGIKEKCLERTTHLKEELTNHCLKADAALRAANKQVESRRQEAARATAEAAAASRRADKLNDKLANMPQGPTFSQELAEAEGALTLTRKELERVSEDSRGLQALLRAKDRQLDAMELRVQEAHSLLLKNKELENRVLELQGELREAAVARGRALEEQRQQDARLALLQAQLEASRGEAGALRDSLASSSTALKASEEQRAQIQEEFSLQRDQLVRVGAVAERAAARESLAGPKPSGTVPLSQHLAEVRYLQGEAERLREKVAAAEKAASSAHLQKEALRKKLEGAATRGSSESPARGPPRWARTPQRPSQARPRSAGKDATLLQLQAELASSLEEAASLRSQLEKSGPRTAGLRQHIRKLEAQLASRPSPLVDEGKDKRKVVDGTPQITPRPFKAPLFDTPAPKATKP